MAQVRTQHPKAKLTPLGRRAMVDLVIVEGWGVAATAERYQVDPKTVRKWRDRFVAEGPGGLVDRSSRPHRSPGRSSPEVRAEVIRLRRCRGAATAWVTDELPAAPARTPPRAVAPEGARTPPPSDKAADAEGPTEAARADLATRLDQLIVRHATWRSVGVMAGIAVTAAAGTWSLRGAMAPPSRCVAGRCWRWSRQRRSPGSPARPSSDSTPCGSSSWDSPTTTVARPSCSSAWSGSSWPHSRSPS